MAPPALSLLALALGAAAQRRFTVKDQKFWDTSKDSQVVFRGTNVVLKAAPWLPEVTGNESCSDADGTTCMTFNEFDARHIRSMGWNMIRLGVTWAGAQPTPEDKLDADFLRRLYAILDLCERFDIAVLLDPHQDGWGSANCGQGVPMWFSKLATPDEIGKPLVHTHQPWAPKNPLKAYKDGTCNASDAATWALFAGEEDYNVKNPCCLLNNGGNTDLIVTQQAQRGWTYLFHGDGRSSYVRFLGLLAEAVKDKPAAAAIEMYNEPFPLGIQDVIWSFFNTQRDIYEEVQRRAPGMLVGLMSMGEGAIEYYENQVMEPFGFTSWIRSQCCAFYAFHWYGNPSSRSQAVHNAIAISQGWHAPALMTEFMDCNMSRMVSEHDIGWLHWHYSQYCNTAPATACVAEHTDCRSGWPLCQWDSSCSFGACITGYGSGNPMGPCSAGALQAQAADLADVRRGPPMWLLEAQLEKAGQSAGQATFFS